jgi:hypothetical protein
LSYTLLRVVEEGLMLFEEHRRRLAPEGGRIATRFDDFARTATPGIYALRAGAGQLTVQRREASRLFEGMPVRWLVSPFAGRRGIFPKLPSPSEYDACRQAGVSTFLTSADGQEINESCSAAVVGWDGEQLIFVPEDRPRVDSTAERALRARVPFTAAPLLRDARLPLALVNAVAGLRLPRVPERDAFPEEACALIRAALAATVRRP